MRLPAFPPPDLARVFGRRPTGTPVDPRVAAVRALRASLGLGAVPLAAVRWALTDPGWCNEAQTPAWRPPWPPNTDLEPRGAALLDEAEVDLFALAAALEARDAWSALFLAPGQQHLPARGRLRVLARAGAALAAVAADHGVSVSGWALPLLSPPDP